jgi:serine/threonine-protein kinase
MFSPEPGVSIGGRYALERLIGNGGMGEVWLAYDRELDGPCAVKFVLQRSAADQELLRRFVREARVAAGLRSPHAVQVLGVGEHEGFPYLVMELLEGETLAARIERQGPLGVDVTLAITGQIAAVLEKARELGIVHRDLKPDNVWLCAQPELFVKVFDFGIAKSPLSARCTATGAIIGSPHYMSPEQVQSSRTVDHRSDVWALGVIALECLSGNRLFEAPALGALVLKIMAGADPGIVEFAARLAPGFDAWVARALAVLPEQRFRTAKELHDSLRQYLAPSSISSTHVSAANVSAAHASAVNASAAHEVDMPPERTGAVQPLTRSQHGAGRRSAHPAVVTLAGVALGLLGVVAGWKLFSVPSGDFAIESLPAPAAEEPTTGEGNTALPPDPTTPLPPADVPAEPPTAVPLGDVPRTDPPAAPLPTAPLQAVAPPALPSTLEVEKRDAPPSSPDPEPELQTVRPALLPAVPKRAPQRVEPAPQKVQPPPQPAPATVPRPAPKHASPADNPGF